MVQQLIIVASTNPVKIEAARLGFSRMFPQVDFHVTGAAITSNVSHQPMTSHETYQGAFSRAQNAAAAHPEADFTIGIEGGVEEIAGRLQVFAWVVVQSKDQFGKAQTGVFYLPEEVAQLVRQGLELGNADDVVFGRSNSKQANGSLGLLTDDALTRTDYYVQAVIMALIPFKKPQFTWR